MVPEGLSKILALPGTQHFCFSRKGAFWMGSPVLEHQSSSKSQPEVGNSGKGSGMLLKVRWRLAAAPRGNSAWRGVSSTNSPERGSGGGFIPPPATSWVHYVKPRKQRLHTYSLLSGGGRKAGRELAKKQGDSTTL